MGKFLSLTVLVVLAIQIYSVSGGDTPFLIPKNEPEWGSGDGTGKKYGEPCFETADCSYPFACKSASSGKACYYENCKSDSDCQYSLGLTCHGNDACGASSCATNSDCNTKDFVCKKIYHVGAYQDACAPKTDPCSKCTADEECNHNSVCVAVSESSPCNKCASHQTCENDKCIAKLSECANCGSDQVCNNGVCVTIDSPCANCTSDQECESGVCIPREDLNRSTGTRTYLLLNLVEHIWNPKQ